MDDSTETCFTPRRTSRQFKPSLKALESASVSVTPVKSGDSSEDSDLETCEHKEKPSVLHNLNRIHGDQIFTFHNRKKRDDILTKAMNVNEAVVPKTPHTIRNKIRKEIISKIKEAESSNDDSDYSDSGSEYVASEKSECEEESSQEEEILPIPEKTVNRVEETVKNVGRSKCQQVNKKYVLNVEEYFTNQAAKTIVTSNHTLDKLETPRLPQDQLQKLLSNLKLSKEHAGGVEGLVESSRRKFSKWMYLLHENFNIIVYGLGSKKKILQLFHEECLKDSPVLVINGFFPSLTLKDVLDAIVVDLLDVKETAPSNVYEACELIENEFSLIPQTHLYVIFHNIEQLRAGKSQNVLARLAAIVNIHLIVSIDHINAPLIWDHSKLSKFNFNWWDITSFYPYLDETSFESSMMVQKSGSLALSSLRNVFLSLTSNSKGIYLILVKYQLDNEKSQYYQGLAFKDLYSSCREAFLVSSDLALRAQMTEFIDHKMVKVKRSHDGTENLIIPIANQVLQQFLNEQS